MPNLVLAWKGDLGFEDEQLFAWRAAELIAEFSTRRCRP